jgi:hypothetical protein
MITKKTVPIIRDKRVIGAVTEYRLFGMLIMGNVLLTPAGYGLTEYEYQLPI